MVREIPINQWFGEVRKDLAEFVRWAGFLPNSDLEKTTWLLFYGFATQDTRLIRSFTNWSKDWLVPRVERARKYKIWRGKGRIAAKWFETEYGDLYFLLDIMVVNGELERREERTGYFYRLTKEGLIISIENEVVPTKT